jgi:hypothetical protein
MLFGRLQGVLGAGGEEAAAVPNEGADGGLVEADQEKENGFHDFVSTDDPIFDIAIPGVFDAETSVRAVFSRFCSNRISQVKAAQ